MQAISAAHRLSTADLTSKVSSPGVADRGSAFAKVLGDHLQSINAHQVQAEGQITKVLAGDTSSVPQLVVDMAKADLAFRFLVELRNRLTDTYQELMRMQI